MKRIARFVRNNWLVLLVLGTLTGFLFKDFIFKGLLPIPLDAVVGAYYPWRDEVWLGREAGFPIKNFAIGDVVRQLYPWRKLAIDQLRAGSWPLWNPYNFTGTPHLANIFVASFYPFNLLFFFLPFPLTWGIYVAIQPLLTGLALYLFLKNLGLSKISALLGSIVFAFSSFLMIRLEFGMVGHTAIWLPLALLAIDKLFQENRYCWWLLAVVSLACSLLAGYFQVTIYSYLLFCFYGFYRFLQNKKIKLLLLIFSVPVFALMLSGIQVIPFLEVSQQSSRIVNYSQENFFAQEFFLPWERLITFLAPDFFGNDVTGNFWGKTSYYEFTGFVGVVPLFFIVYSLFSLRRERVFWWLVTVFAFFLLLPNPISRFFYSLRLPGFSVLVPARMLFVVNFSWAILAAFGLEEFEKDRVEKRKLNSQKAILFLILAFAIIAIVFLAGLMFWPLWQKNALVSLRNLVLPAFSLLCLFAFLPVGIALRKEKLRIFVLAIFIAVISFNLLRHALKYNPFIEKEVLFPHTEAIDFLLKKTQEDRFRILITHQDLLTSNMNLPYGLEMVEGYDSVHSKRFEELAMAANFMKSSLDYQSPGRVLFLTCYQSPLFDLMNVKYILALEEIRDSKLRLVFRKGKTRVYENLKSYPRAYLTRNFEVIKDKEKILAEMLRFSREGEKGAVLEEDAKLKENKRADGASEAEIVAYAPQEVKIKTQSSREEILVFSDAYDPGWKALVDGKKTKVYRANYNFRAIVLPAGEHLVNFVYQPFSFKLGLVVSGITLTGLGLLILVSMKQRRL
jgi:uncharacterized membrane protein YfhO